MAKMQLTVFLLFLMGLCCFSTCQLYEYHYIDITRTWTEAQAFCRHNYTDLATVTNMTDMERLVNARGRQEVFNVMEEEEGAWIGLYKADIEKRWHWSLPGLEFNETEIKWGQGEPNDAEGPENCGYMRWNNSELMMGDVSCDNTDGVFLCYDETTDKTHLEGKHMKWLEALNHCRQIYTDLASGPELVKSTRDKTDPKNFMLIGLFRDTWLWSDNSSFSFRNWHVDFHKTDTDQKQCAMVDEDNTWKSINCDEPKHFICYDDKVILVKEQMTWVEALEYCRERHHELVSITDLNQQRWIQDRAKQADTKFVWLGLRYTCTLDFWFWITDEVVSYNNWDPHGQKNDCDMSGAMDTKGKHKWISKPDEERFNFICFKD